MKRLQLSILLLCISCAASAQVSTQNYISKRTILNETGTSYMDGITYYDGLGRPFQKVQKAVREGINPTNTNLITLQEYNVAGKETNTWLPLATSSEYIEPAVFKSSIPASYNSDTHPYNQTVYEMSPLNRIIEQYGAGAAWNSHPVSTAYLGNTVSSPLNCLSYTISNTGALINNGNFAANKLNVLQTKDEDEHISYTFTDKQGHTLLTRQMKNGETNDTYYVYDDSDNLCFVLQPMYQSNNNLSLYAFQYKYDGRNRCIEKKLPSTEAVKYVYDKANNLIFSQDGNQRINGQWTFYLYDNLQRLTVQGICNNSNTASASSVIVTCTRADSNSGLGDSDYTSSFALTSPAVHIVNYYDNYNFRSLTGFNNASYFPAATVSGKGMLTGNVTTVLPNGDKLYSSYYYNIKSLMTKSVQSNLLGGYDTTDNTYTFSGKPLTVQHIHTASGKDSQKINYTYSYDYAERLSQVLCSLNGGSNIALLDNTYDVLGRLSTKAFHNASIGKLTYAYNIRNWVTGMASTPFSQNLYYNTGNGAACYNGNVSSMTWKGNDAVTRGYKFGYDGLSRIIAAAYGEGTSINTNTNRFTENVSSYDKNGNILGLQRYGQTGASTYGLVDNLTLTLSGNQLNRVDDASTSSAYSEGFEFKNGASATGEYTYDANGNLTKDLNKNITNIQYNYLNLPSKITFGEGSTIVYLYGADGTKLRTTHTINGTVTKTDYCGNVIYENDTATRLLTEVGYVSLNDNQYHYYLQDHQGNNRVVIDQSGIPEETNNYYPFGGTFACTKNVQPYKYNGKEFDSKKGLNLYDYGARHYDAALGRFMTNDKFAEKYSSISQYAYCVNNPINAIDPDGRLVIFINGMNAGNGGKPDYWSGFDTKVMNRIKDWNADYIDGSHGGTKSLPWNLSANERKAVGYERGIDYAKYFLFAYKDGDGSFKESIKVITHSMGAAYAKGFIQGLIDGGVPINMIEFEADFAPFQPTKQEAVKGVRTLQYSHSEDWIARNEKMKGAEYEDTSSDKNQTHSIADFMNQIQNLPEGKYKFENGKIVSY